MTGHPRTPAEISTSKTSNLHRTPTAFTKRPLDDIGLRLVVQTRPDRPALYAQPTDANKAPMRHVFLGSRLRTPASSPPSLTTEQLPSACGWCHQPPQGTRTPELLVMSRAHRACGSPAHGSPTFFTAGIRLSPPGPVGPERDDESVEIDQPHAVVQEVGHRRHPISAGALVAFGDQHRLPARPERADQALCSGSEPSATVAQQQQPNNNT